MRQTVPWKINSISSNLRVVSQMPTSHFTKPPQPLKHFFATNQLTLKIDNMQRICEQLCDNAGYTHNFSQYHKSNCGPKSIDTGENTESKQVSATGVSCVSGQASKRLVSNYKLRAKLNWPSVTTWRRASSSEQTANGHTKTKTKTKANKSSTLVKRSRLNQICIWWGMLA